MNKKVKISTKKQDNYNNRILNMGEAIQFLR